MNNFLEIGNIIGAHGINGEIKVFPLSRDASIFTKIKYLYIQNRKFKIISVKNLKHTALLALEGITSRNQAEELKKAILSIEKNQLPKLDTGTYYMVDLIHCEIYENNVLKGYLKDVLKTGSNDVYVIDLVEKQNNNEVLLPAIKEVVLKIDIQNKRIDVKFPKGIFDDEYF